MVCERIKSDFIDFPGGDWGSVIGLNMATLFPESVIGELVVLESARFVMMK
jgi:hypothetical protein